MVSDEIFTFSTYYAHILKKEIKADDSITDQFCQIAGNPAKLIEVLRHKGRFLKPIIFWRI